MKGQGAGGGGTGHVSCSITSGTSPQGLPLIKLLDSAKHAALGWPVLAGSIRPRCQTATTSPGGDKGGNEGQGGIAQICFPPLPAVLMPYAHDVHSAATSPPGPLQESQHAFPLCLPHFPLCLSHLCRMLTMFKDATSSAIWPTTAA